MKNKRIKMTDDAGHFWLDGKLYKLYKPLATTREEAMKGIHQGEYVVVKPEEYDKTVNKLAERISKYPDVDLLDILRDALYDMPLKYVIELDKRLDKEEIKAKEEQREPRIKTARGERGTCVELRINGRYGMQIRV